MRTVIFHYHLFKNAGTSVDAILQQNFPGRWLSAEFAGQDNQRAVAEWIGGHPEAVAFSSHTAQPPLPDIEDVVIFPIVFLRHPLDRIRSAYLFERQQVSDSFGARLAKATDLPGYIRTRLENSHDRQCRNFQASRLCRFAPGPASAELDRALSALCQLPLVGIVEDFDQSMALLETLLRPAFPEFRSFSARRNATSARQMPLHERMSELRAEIGVHLYQELIDINMKDICLHHAGATRLAVRMG